MSGRKTNPLLVIVLVLSTVLLTLAAVLVALAPSVSAATVRYYPSCTNREATRGSVPCIWDGKTRGNFTGRSYRVTAVTGGVATKVTLSDRTCESDSDRNCRSVFIDQQLWTLPNGVQVSVRD